MAGGILFKVKYSPEAAPFANWLQNLSSLTKVCKVQKCQGVHCLGTLIRVSRKQPCPSNECEDDTDCKGSASCSCGSCCETCAKNYAKCEANCVNNSASCDSCKSCCETCAKNYAGCGTNCVNKCASCERCPPYENTCAKECTKCETSGYKYCLFNSCNKGICLSRSVKVLAGSPCPVSECRTNSDCAVPR